MSDDLPFPDEAELAEINARNGELAERDRVRDVVIAHVDELSLDEMRALGRWLAAMQRGRQFQGVIADESDQDLADSVAYLEMQLAARGVKP